MGYFTVYQLILSAASIADLFSSLRAHTAPKRGVIDAREAFSHQEHHGQQILLHKFCALRYQAEGGGEGQDGCWHVIDGTRSFLVRGE
jgi:hypothetical protein